jgi:type I restriction enzyme S subunit
VGVIPALDVTPAQRKTLLAFLRRFIPKVEVWAYGSRVKWTARPNSDLDLVVFSTPSQHSLISELKEALDESNLPFPVDVHIWDEVPERFHEIIRKEYVVLVEKTGKKSGVRSNLCRVPLSDYITLQRGFDLPQNDRKEGLVPVVASTGIVGLHNEAKVKGPGVVIGRSGSIGGGQYIESDFWPLNTTLWVKDFKGHNPRYAYYLLRNIDFSGFNVGSGVPTLNRNHLTSIEVIDFDEQSEKEIAEILGSLDDKLELNRQINHTLEQIAQAIFKSWFVDFEPVKAKIQAKKEGRDPERAAIEAIAGKGVLQYATTEELAATAALFPDELVESELGLIPKGWKVGNLGTFGDIVCGKTPSKTNAKLFGGYIPFVKIPDMHNSAFITKTVDSLSEEGALSQRNKFIPPYSVIVSCIATVGLVAITSEKCQTNQQINAIISRKNYFPFYVYFCVKNLRGFLKDLGSGGSATLNVNTTSFANINCIVPTDDVLISFDKIVRPIFEQILSNDRQNDGLANLRDTLLPKLLSGEIELKEVI